VSRKAIRDALSRAVTHRVTQGTRVVTHEHGPLSRIPSSALRDTNPTTRVGVSRSTVLEKLADSHQKRRLCRCDLCERAAARLGSFSRGDEAADQAGAAALRPDLTPHRGHPCDVFSIGPANPQPGTRTHPPPFSDAEIGHD
jgi:hypothetical protein